MLRHRLLVGALAGLLLSTGVLAGALLNFSDDLAARLPLFYGLLGAFCALYVAELFLITSAPSSLALYLPIQTLLVAVLLLLPPLLDTFAVFYIALLIQVTPVMRPRTSLLWAAAFAVVAGSTFLLDAGFPGALGQIFIYGAAYFFVAIFNITLNQLENTRKQLQAYIHQAEELAVMEERNRLARELHDSVSQSIFGMSFTIASARTLSESDPAQIPSLLDRLSEQANRALAEMRGLIFELRPLGSAGKSLSSGLYEHLARLEQEQDLVVELHVHGEERLTPVQSHHIFRIIQEALNNIVKHAGVDQAAVELDFQPGQVLVTISDAGRGFELTEMENKEHMGMASMRERLTVLGGSMEIDTAPGRGVRVRARIPHDESKEG